MDSNRPGGATETKGQDLVRIRMGQKEPSRSGGTICYGLETAAKTRGCDL